jgi:hypothetical protein
MQGGYRGRQMELQSSVEREVLKKERRSKSAEESKVSWNKGV